MRHCMNFIWCDGLKKPSNKRARSLDSSSEDELEEEISKTAKKQRKDTEKDNTVEIL